MLTAGWPKQRGLRAAWQVGAVRGAAARGVRATITLSVLKTDAVLCLRGCLLPVSFVCAAGCYRWDGEASATRRSREVARDENK